MLLRKNAFLDKDMSEKTTFFLQFSSHFVVS